MFPSTRIAIQRTVFWPLMMLALLARLTFGGIASPSTVFDDPIKEIGRLNVLCDDKAPFSGPTKHHTPVDSQTDTILLADALELFEPIVIACTFAALSVISLSRVWMFAPIRGPPSPGRTSLCSQGPPA